MGSLSSRRILFQVSQLVAYEISPLAYLVGSPEVSPALGGLTLALALITVALSLIPLCGRSILFLPRTRRRGLALILLVLSTHLQDASCVFHLSLNGHSCLDH